MLTVCWLSDFPILPKARHSGSRFIRMDHEFIEKITSKSFVNVVINAVIGLFFAMFIASFFLPFVEDFPAIQRIILQIIGVIPWLAGFGIVLLVPAIVKHLIAVKNGAPLFSLRSPSKRYQPWPAHTDPRARRTAWGGLDPKNDIRGRLTKAKKLSESTLIFTTPWLRRIAACVFLTTGLALLLTYPVTHAFVYEVVPPHIEALRHTTYMTWPLLVFWGCVILIFGICLCSTAIRVAKIDKQNDKVLLYKQRFYGLFNKLFKPEIASLPISEVAGLQIISYRARNARKNKRLLDQYELNLVLNDGKRKMLSKQSSHKTIQQDALQVARFLKLPIWDRSGYYSPDDLAILQPVDPLIRPL